MKELEDLINEVENSPPPKKPGVIVKHSQPTGHYLPGRRVQAPNPRRPHRAFEQEAAAVDHGARADLVQAAPARYLTIV